MSSNTQKKVDELRRALEGLGLSSKGLKADLVERLTTAQIVAPENASSIPDDVHALVTKAVHSKMELELGVVPFSERIKSAMVYDKAAAIEGIIPDKIVIHYTETPPPTYKRYGNPLIVKTLTKPTKKDLKDTINALLQRQLQDELRISFVMMERGHIRARADLQGRVSLSSTLVTREGAALLHLITKTAGTYKFEIPKNNKPPNVVFDIVFEHLGQPLDYHERLVSDLMLGIKWMKTYIFQENGLALITRQHDPVIKVTNLTQNMPKDTDKTYKIEKMVLKKLKAVLNPKKQ